jgi:hypothetical protein
VLDLKGPYRFERNFGTVRQHECQTKKMFGRMETVMVMSAVALSEKTAQPTAALLDDLNGRDGLTTDPSHFHVVGVLSLAGWPAGFRSGSLSGPNISYVFVEPGIGESWNIYPAGAAFGDLFDPEPVELKLRRDIATLENYGDLIASGGIASIDAICRDTKLSAERIEAAVVNSAGKFRLLKEPRRTAVIRASGV